MAKVYRRKETKYWHASYQVWDAATGKWKPVLRSTFATDKTKAQAVAAEFERVANIFSGEGTSRATRAMALKSVNAILRVSGFVEEQITQPWDSYAAEWLNAKAANSGKSTIEAYRSAVKRFNEWLGPRASQGLNNIGASDMQRFYNHIASERTHTTAANTLKPLRQILERAYLEGLTARNPVALVEKAPRTAREREPFTPTDISMLIAYLTASDAPDSADWVTMIYLGLCTGARMGDCASMTTANIVNGSIRFVPQKVKRRNRPVILPVMEPLKSHLAKKAPVGPLCPTLYGREVSGQTGLSTRFLEILEGAKISLHVEHTGAKTWRSKSFHSLRHTLASLMANAGVPEDVRRKIVDHDSSEVHAGYVHLEQDTFKVHLEKALSTIQARPAPLKARKSPPAG